jgi:hypothetical protein
MIHPIIERIVLGIEVFSVAIIVLGRVFGAIRGIADFFNKARRRLLQMKIADRKGTADGTRIFGCRGHHRDRVILKLIISEILS